MPYIMLIVYLPMMIKDLPKKAQEDSRNADAQL